MKKRPSFSAFGGIQFLEVICAVRHALMPFALCLAILSSRAAQALDAQIETALTSQIQQLVCSDGGEWLRCYRLEPKSCATVTEAFVRPCVASVLGPVKSQMSYDEGVTASKKLVECFNERFLSSYGSQKLSTPQCSQPPKHLQGEAVAQ